MIVAAATGLIPAHAGKTAAGAGLALAHGAHPRSRGENESRQSARQRPRGSSPLTRGKPRWDVYDGNTLRLIPAHAGKTRSPPCPPLSGQAHPRSRGENAGLAVPTVRSYGSSPLTRGKQLRAWPGRPAGRLIPAHAGKTYHARSWPPMAEAHPRSRGENRQSASTATVPSGSSPLTRGKQRVPRRRPDRIRLIPAHAGKTGSRRPPPARSTAHPRSRGENALTWQALDARRRLIPAHAGKTADDVG